jgi:hypothetical protein
VDFERYSDAVEMSWMPVAGPSHLGYHVYRGPSGGDVTTFQRVTAAPLQSPAWTDSNPPSYQEIEYCVTAIDSFLWESQWSSPQPTYVHAPEPYPQRLLLVNGFDWATTSDGAGTAVLTDPWEMYRDFVLTAGLPFDFWDLFPNAPGYPPGTIPLGVGPLTPDVLFRYSGIIWAGNDNTSDSINDKLEFRKLEPHFRWYLQDGGTLVLLSHFLGSYMTQAFARDICRISRWEALQSFRDTNPAYPVWPGLVSMTPISGLSFVFGCEPFSPDSSGLVTPIVRYRASDTFQPILGAFVKHPTRLRDRMALFSMPSSSVEHQELEQNMAQVILHLTGITGVGGGPEESPGRPERLLQNAPNPVRKGTIIAFELARPGPARLRIFDSAGRLVRTLLDEAVLSTAHQSVPWDGLDSAGRPVPSGVYFYRLEGPSSTQTKKLVVAR